MTPSAPYLNSDVQSMINKHIANLSSFSISIQTIMMMMMKYYELEEERYKKQ